MRKELKFCVGLMFVMSISGCTIHTQDGSSAIENETSIMHDETIREPEETTADGLLSIVKDELTIQDILVPEDECLRDTPFMAGSVECVMKYNPDLERIKSEEHFNYCFNYWKGDGIEYVTTSEDLDIYGLIITANYSLNCGLKIGMRESDLQKYFPVMEKYEKGNLKEGRGQIIFAGNLMTDKLGALQTTDYDCAYACVCAASEKEVEKYQIKVTTAYSVTAFVKDEEVCKIVLDLPMAN